MDDRHIMALEVVFQSNVDITTLIRICQLSKQCEMTFNDTKYWKMAFEKGI
jgi:hypothetical protein